MAQKFYQNYPIGEMHHNAKLCNDKVRVIRYMHLTWGVRIAHLSALFGVDRRTIRRAITREHWTHI
jgi:hypothetical protein